MKPEIQSCDFVFFAAVATHGQAEHPGGLTPAVPVRQQVLRCGEQTLVYVSN